MMISAMNVKELRFLKALICVVLFAAILLVYWQVTGFGFVNFDDPRYVSENPFVRQGLTLKSILWAYTTVYASNWHPLTWISHMMDVEFFGMNPGMHHIMNVLFHILNTLLLFLVLQKMTGAIWKSAAVAALFALHPLHVESVAWIAERKDVLSTFFWMLTMMCYVFYVQNRKLWTYLAVVIFYVLGLLSKPMLVTLPFVLLLLDYWPLKRLESPLKKDISTSHDTPAMAFRTLWSRVGTLVAEKAPLFILALISSGVTFYAQRSWGAVVAQELMPIHVRLANVTTSYFAYLAKMFWPLNLAVFYPFPSSIKLLTILLCLAVLLLLTFLVLIFARSLPYLFVGWFWYLGTMIPVIGLVQVGAQAMADRYTYIPLIGIFLMVVWGLADILRKSHRGEAALTGVFIVITLLLMAITWRQIGFWKDSETLFSHALHVTKNNDVAYLNLGNILLEKGDVNGAMKNFQEVLRINPANPKVYLNIGQALEAKKLTQDAYEYYRKGLEIDPLNADIHMSLGTLLAGMNKTDDAERHFKEALKTNPNSIEAQTNLGNLLFQTGNLDGAIRHYTQALRINPHQAEVYNNLGTVYINKGNIKKAIEFYQQALQEEPGYAAAMENLKNARTNQKVFEDMVLKTRGLINSDPHNPELHTRLGNTLGQLGEYDGAVAEYQKAITIQPRFTAALYGMALVLSSQEKYTEALDILNKMKEIQPDNPDIYYNIACIFAKQGKPDESITWLKRAIEKGFNNWTLISKDPDLAGIRDTPYVKKLVMDHNIKQ